MKKTPTPRQSAYIRAYAEPSSPTFGNSYQSALGAGYTHETARNITHLAPEWLSENIGQIAVIQPDEIMKELTVIIKDNHEPTIIRLKAMELSMRAYNMLIQHKSAETKAVSLSIDLSA